ncbi:FtsK/SpoIIIE domain-containing protein [Cryobacterium sp. CG_9.6]|uniref:FtsK/SpoIIIE domain-containing protein n=1 Tax=Cryobacterium sp. CG_9.6 TaxID=2760710 RepID=UPI002472F545|nr:FtsK/SpoIIIE domain-containing protein [Cryobacterium sp. CG_9.6]MDH6236479.1 S-DNA-T family DNA segregation ATPase FtsK/SpoIIIE [Cryobacterium sp. CG_9.6]
MILPDEPLTLPPKPVPPPPPPFPLLATLAPLGAAALIWFVTGSAFALVFAVLSPVIAIASMADARRTQRKRALRDAVTYADALEQLRTSVAERLDGQRQQLCRRTPSVACILEQPVGVGRWRRSGATTVSLGLGTIDSDLRLSAATTPGEQRELRQFAAILPGAPITVDAVGGIGIIGPPALTRAMGRCVLVQLCHALPPTECAVSSLTLPGWEWLTGLPHSRTGATHGSAYCLVVVEARSALEAPERTLLTTALPDTVLPDTAPATGGTSTALVITLAEHIEDLPPGPATVVRVHGPQRAVLLAADRHTDNLEFHPELVTTEAALCFAVHAREQAVAAGLDGGSTLMPRVVTLSEIGHLHPPENGPGASSSLACLLGRSDGGDVIVDLVRSGPHAVVGGTTGSGKSELLVTWITALAGSYSPAQVTFLLVDFKGGAAFRPLQTLPHCVGLITDLDAGAASRALSSLAAELRYREGVLAAAQVSDVTDARLSHGPQSLSRLVIVIDEFATMINAFPELHALFVDIAARGRSLGVHLILCTQRPAGVVKDALLANCSLRLSLRVNNGADSQAVIGTNAAALISPQFPGRCLIAASAGEPTSCQVATTEPTDIADARGAVSKTQLTGVRRPWLEPLPSTLTDVHLAGTDGDMTAEHGNDFLLGLLDEPEQQRYRVARWNPQSDGHLLVVGCAGSGKSSLLRTLATQQRRVPVDLVSADVEATWDGLSRAHSALAASAPDRDRVLVLDDFDSVCARWEAEHRFKALEMLTTILRDGPARGLTVVISVQRLTGGLNSLTALCSTVLLLRMSSLQEHLAAGGQSAHFDPSLPAGGGRLHGLRVQLLAPPAGTTPSCVREVTHLGDQALIVVSSVPAATAALWRAARGPGVQVVEITGIPTLTTSDRLELSDGHGARVVIGDAEAWQAQWALLSTLRSHLPIVFDRASLADYRVIGRRRDLPPALAPDRGHVWVLQPDGSVVRGSLPVAPTPTPGGDAA